MNVIALPVFSYNNVFAVTEINNKIIAIDKEKLTYVIVTEKDLKDCININSQYTCEHATPTYRVNLNAPCEIQIYTQQRQRNCKTKYIISMRTTWIALQQLQTWLYSTATEQQLTIQYDKRQEYKTVIKNTGKITLKGKCKLITPDMTIQTKQTIYETDIETYLPEYNLTLVRERNTITHDNDTIQDIGQHRMELTKLKLQLEEIDNNLKSNEQNFFAKKQFVYPMATSGTITITIIIILIVLYIVIRNKNKRRKRPLIRIYDEERSEPIDRLPKPILKRSLSTRF